MSRLLQCGLQRPFDSLQRLALPLLLRHCACPPRSVSFWSDCHEDAHAIKHATSFGLSSRAPAAASMRLCRATSSHCSCHADQPLDSPALAIRLAAFRHSSS
eukprot:scaffold11924_cov39-Phaeocystis_antarctica.AAC.1